jgi:hypothetical protein
MFWNIAIAVGAGAAQFVNAWLGWRVTSANPLTPRQRKVYDILFVAVGLLGLVFIGLAASRPGPERAHLKVEPHIAYEFPESLKYGDLWRFASNFLPINSPLRMNLSFTNVGNGSAINFRNNGRVYIEPDFSLASAHDAVSKFNAWLKIQPVAPATTFTRDEYGFITYEGDILTPEDFQNIVFGRRLIYVIGVFTFEDDAGTHYHNVCTFLLPPISGGLLIWKGCGEHTEEK